MLIHHESNSCFCKTANAHDSDVIVFIDPTLYITRDTTHIKKKQQPLAQ